MRRVTINNVNKALQDTGIDAIIVRGKDYYYFVGEDISCECEAGVYCGPQISNLSIEEWVEEAKVRMVKENS